MTAFSVGFAGALASVLSYPLISGYTAASLGILSVLAGILLGQKAWYRSQRRFSRDFDRITGMLQGDLQVGRFVPCAPVRPAADSVCQAVLETALESRLLAKPNAAVDGLERLRKDREEKLNELEGRLAELTKTLS